MSLRRLHMTSLGVSGVASALAAALGVFCVRNAALAQEWHICGFPVGCIDNGGPDWRMPTTSVTLPDGSPLDFGLYAALILASGILTAIAALQLISSRRRPAWRLILCVAAASLALSLVLVRLPAPTRLIGFVGPCGVSLPCPMQYLPYPNPIPSVLYLVPAAVLGLVAAVFGLFPSRQSTLGPVS